MIKGNVILDHIEGTPKSFLVVQGFEYEDDEFCVKVNPGWVTDGASTPRFIWWLFPPIAGRYLEASVLHDALYRSQIFTKEESDLIFYRAMLEMHVPDGHALIMYYSVKYFGNRAWENNKKLVKKYRDYVKGFRKKNAKTV